MERKVRWENWAHLQQTALTRRARAHFRLPRGPDGDILFYFGQMKNLSIKKFTNRTGAVKRLTGAVMGLRSLVKLDRSFNHRSNYGAHVNSAMVIRLPKPTHYFTKSIFLRIALFVIITCSFAPAFGSLFQFL